MQKLYVSEAKRLSTYNYLIIKHDQMFASHTVKCGGTQGKHGLIHEKKQRQKTERRSVTAKFH